MMILAWIGVGLFGLALIIVIIGFLMPKQAYMKREVIINSDKQTIFAYANDLKKFVENWSPWTEKDPDMETIYEGADAGVGAVYKWKGDKKKVGYGTMKIVESVPDEKVVSFLNFGGRGDAEVTLRLEGSDGEVKAIWEYAADNGNNPIARIFGSMMDKFLGPDFEKGLKKLKEVCED
ncbi:SRPBCC family protein [Parvicella tangerina]|uniref:Polyketide cyclase n=1 Tax=Parvicella tangerina TaxID=2829795 RepID=A0A916NPL8_9FLAO|nr:SRPBCC family protein [Parvicella tangerina]CAG5076985.1 hypothetical protein CRYO30217_00263 [Parvicella tangerina]